MQEAAGNQLLGDHRNAAQPVHVDGIVLAARTQVADQRRALENPGDVVHGEADAGLVGDGRNVHAGIGRSAGRRDDGAGVLQAFDRNQVARQRTAALEDFHHRVAGAPGDGVAFGPHRRDQGAAERREPITSPTMPMVLAVNWPGQAPMVGITTCSRSSRSSRVISPVMTAPAPS